jgi:hypothetical protein
MLRCASPFVVAAYAKVRLTPQGSRALPAAFLRSRPIFKTFKTFYEAVNPSSTNDRKRLCTSIAMDADP